MGVNPNDRLPLRTGGPLKARDVFAKAGRPAKRKEARKALKELRETLQKRNRPAQTIRAIQRNHPKTDSPKTQKMKGIN